MYSFPAGGHGSTALSGALLAYPGPDLKTWVHERRGLFPTLCTLMAFVILCSPVMSGVSLAFDTNASYWLSVFGWTVLLVPLMLAASHAIHVCRGQPNFLAMLLSTVMPALFVIVMGFAYHGHAHYISARLLSTDCTSDAPKLALNEAYRAADRQFQLCVEKASKVINVSAVQDKMVFPDCPTFSEGDAALRWRREWDYLRELEETQGCAGWCDYTTSAVFTASKGKHDACSQVAGVMFATTVSGHAFRMWTVGLLSLLVGLLMFMAVQEHLVRTGIQW